jgi:hypothetical protein
MVAECGPVGAWLGSGWEAVMDAVVAVGPVGLIEEVITPAEELALGGFLAGYSGLTRDAYALDLRQWTAWCTARSVTAFGARRADIARLGRHLEALGRARATLARRLCTIACFYRYAEEEGLITVSPAGARARAPPRLRVPRHRPGPQRGRRPARRSWARPPDRARPVEPARL